MLTRIVSAKSNGSLYDIVQPNKSTLSGGNGGAAAKINDASTLDGVGVSRYNSDIFGSTVLAGDSVTSAGGTLAYNNQSPIAKRLTTEINGSSNTVLQSGASVPSLTQSIHYMRIAGMGYADGTRTTRTTSAIRSGYWNLYTGQFDNGYPVHGDDLFSGSDNSSGDKAAKPTRSVPGSLTYKYASPVLETTNYKAKTG